MAGSAPKIYYHAPAPAKTRARHVTRVHKAYPEIPAEHLRLWMREIYLPADHSWALICPAHTATLATYELLFRLRFGAALPPHPQPTHGVGPDTTAETLAAASVLRPCIETLKGVDLLAKTLRITIVRNPTDRAIAAFEALCAAQDAGTPWLYNDRLRLTAQTGFDWLRHARTADGFGKFLRYVATHCSNEAELPVNPNWRPQKRIIKPDLFQPDIIGKVEDFRAFGASVAAGLGLAAIDIQPFAPRHEPPLRREAYLNRATNRELLGKIYAGDYETFGYDAP